MDLSERKSNSVLRHPWETARLDAIRAIVRDLGLEHPRVLDVGCGDGFLVRQLHREFQFSEVVAQDLNFTDAHLAELAVPDIQFVREPADTTTPFDIVLLLDVLEHAEPLSLLRELVMKRLAPGGRLVITVPAFQQLFGAHDRALKHRRRYSREELVREVDKAGLQVLNSGYLFASLLIPRALGVFIEKWIRSPQHEQGIGAWRGSATLTSALHTLFTLDNRLCLAANARGLSLPGLSVWMTCKTSS